MSPVGEAGCITLIRVYIGSVINFERERQKYSRTEFQTDARIFTLSGIPGVTDSPLQEVKWVVTHKFCAILGAATRVTMRSPSVWCGPCKWRTVHPIVVVS